MGGDDETNFWIRCAGVTEMQSEAARELTILSPAMIHQILDHLGVQASPLPRAPTSDPDWEQVAFGFDAA